MKQKRSDRELLGISAGIALPILFAVAAALWLFGADKVLHDYILVMGAFFMLMFAMNHAARRMWSVAAVLFLLAVLLLVAIFLPSWERLPLEWTKLPIDLQYLSVIISMI